MEFYSDLAELIKSIPKHNVVLTEGDMNAKIGQIDSNGSAFHDTANRNGQHLLDFLTECVLVDLSMQFMK